MLVHVYKCYFQMTKQLMNTQLRCCEQDVNGTTKWFLLHILFTNVKLSSVCILGSSKHLRLMDDLNALFSSDQI